MFLVPLFDKLNPDKHRPPDVIVGESRVELGVNEFSKFSHPVYFWKRTPFFFPHVETDPFIPKKHALDRACIPFLDMAANEFFNYVFLVHKMDLVTALNHLILPPPMTSFVKKKLPKRIRYFFFFRFFPTENASLRYSPTR